MQKTCFAHIWLKKRDVRRISQEKHARPVEEDVSA
jgi:hypothetical protein